MAPSENTEADHQNNEAATRRLEATPTETVLTEAVAEPQIDNEANTQDASLPRSMLYAPPQPSSTSPTGVTPVLNQFETTSDIDMATSADAALTHDSYYVLSSDGYSSEVTSMVPLQSSSVQIPTSPLPQSPFPQPSQSLALSESSSRNTNETASAVLLPSYSPTAPVHLAFTDSENSSPSSAPPASVASQPVIICASAQPLYLISPSERAATAPLSPPTAAAARSPMEARFQYPSPPLLAERASSHQQQSISTISSLSPYLQAAQNSDFQYDASSSPYLSAASPPNFYTDPETPGAIQATNLPSLPTSDEITPLPPSESQMQAFHRGEFLEAWYSTDITIPSEEDPTSTAPGIPQNGAAPPSIDHSFIRIPLECSIRIFRNFQKQIEKEMSVICNFLEKKILQEADTKVLLTRLNTALEKLEMMRQRTEASQKDAELYFSRCIVRINKILDETNIQVEQSKNDFNFSDYDLRINWLLHEYFLRRGFVKTAEKLVQVEHLQGLVDTSVYEIGNKIVQSLRNHETEPALNWCATHRSRLVKLESSLETHLRLQHMLGLLFKEQYKEAVAYIRDNVTAEDFEKCSDMKRAMALLASWQDPPAAYKDLFSERRWEKLVKLFEEACSKIYFHSSVPSIELVLQAGMSALKSQRCTEHKSISCPACLPEWLSYTSELPSPHRVQSCLICPISGEVMDTENPPMVSPDGRVYSQNALKTIALHSVDGTMIECPFTKNRYPLDKFRKIFVT